MALPTRNDCKSHLRIETTDEDTVIDGLLARAKYLIERALDYPLVNSATRAFTDYNEKDNYGQPPVLRLPGPFKTSSPTPTVADVDGTTVSSDTYWLDNREGIIRARPGYSFPNRPYTVTAQFGLDAHPDATQLEGVASQIILDLVAHLYLHRDSAELSHTDEGGGSQSVSPNAIPSRIREQLLLLPGKHALGLR